MKRAWRALLLIATSTLVVCGVKGPPRPPAQEDCAAESCRDAGAACTGCSADAGRP